jgi:hypothetical protein
MVSSRLFAIDLTKWFAATLLVASWFSLVSCPPLEAASPAGGGWKAAGAGQPTYEVAPAAYAAPSSNTANPSTSAPRWRMPTAHIGSGNSQAVRTAAHSTSQITQRNAESVASHYEPTTFQPADAARPMAARQPRDVAPMAGVQRHTPSAAIPPSRTSAPPRWTGDARPMDPYGPRPNAIPSHARRFAARQRAASYGSKLWNTINVAFEGADQLTAEPETLPLPEQRRNQSRLVPPARRAPSMPMQGEILHGPDPYYENGHDMHLPYGEHGACGDEFGCADCADGCGDGMCGCEPGCGCSAEAGCACEPECGCPCGCGAETPCILACGDDVCIMGEGDAEACHTIRIGIPKWQELMVFGGVHGFKGPYDQTRDSGNFGFHEGFNAGFKVPFSDAGYQIGYQAVHSQLHGDKDTGISDPHTQQFVTVGLFRRAQNGIQIGLAWDMLRDERFGAIDFHQLRGELSMIDRGCHEFGLAVAAHLNEHEMFPADEDNGSPVFQATDQYLLFYRFHGDRGGEGRVYGGINDDEDAIIGADAILPIHDRWSLATGFTYLIAEEDAGQEGASHEAWNLGISMVWHWDCRARKSHSNCYRPLFNVADNGYLIVDERPGAPATGG